MVGGQPTQGEPSLPLAEVKAACCCLRLCALQAPLSLSPEGLLLHLSDNWNLPLSLIFVIRCSCPFLFIYAHSPFTRVGSTFFLLEQTCSPRELPKKQQLLNVMTHVMKVMAHDNFWSGVDGSQSWQSWGGYTNGGIWWENSFQTSYSHSQTDFRKSTNRLHILSLWVYMVWTYSWEVKQGRMMDERKTGMKDQDCMAWDTEAYRKSRKKNKELNGRWNKHLIMFICH